MEMGGYKATQGVREGGIRLRTATIYNGSTRGLGGGGEYDFIM